MGTRRSRHNKGRKPFHKEHRLTASELLERRPYAGIACQHLDANFTWSDDSKSALVTLCNADAPLEASALALARKPSAIAWQARSLGLLLPSEWSSSIRPKYIPRIRLPKITLAYPYIIKERDEHTDLLALNDLVPRAFPDQMRADICQEMMLAVLEGRSTVEEIKANRTKSAWFFRKFWMANHEDSGRAVSMSGFENDDRSYDEIASSIAAKEWHEGQVFERQRYVNAMTMTYQSATQLDDVWRMQVARVQHDLNVLGQSISFEEAAEIIENGEYRRPNIVEEKPGKFTPQLRQRGSQT